MLDFTSPYAQDLTPPRSEGSPETPQSDRAAKPCAAISRLVVILPHQQRSDLPALAAAEPRRDVVLVDGEVSEAFAIALSARGLRHAVEIDPTAPLETRIARSLRNQTRRRISVTKPKDAAVYERVIGWAAEFGVTVDIYFEAVSDRDRPMT